MRSDHSSNIDASQLNAEGAVDRAAAAFARLRDEKVAVHCLTNTVAQGFTANCLLALGVRPSMTDSTDEVGHFVRDADALLVNLGTLHVEQRAAMEIAVNLAAEAGRPWVLDPVFAEVSPPRADFARALMRRQPAIIRGNSGEIQLLVDNEQAGAIIVETGAVDLIRDGECQFSVANGSSLLPVVTATGCAGAAVTAALIAVSDTPFIAGLAGALVMGIAGEMASTDARGPGSFAMHLIDRLAALSAEDIANHARVSA